MDLAPFEKDIDELLDEYSQCGSPSFSAFKKVWSSRKFSYLYEGRPTSNSAVFMQSLYAHCIGNMTRPGTLQRRLGGLYCLYCLYEIQPFKPCFKIYISLGQLKHLKQLVVDAKDGVVAVTALVKRMLERHMFLFGSVDTVGGSLKQRVDEIKRLQNKLVETAYDKLLANSQIEEYLHMNLGLELDLNGLKKMSTDYARAKELAIREASETVEVGEVKQMAERGEEVGTKLEELVARWEARRKDFSRQTGIARAAEAAEPTDEFGAELELLLSED
ncbi:unnamed protein product [Spirodela intermedia]|uniref:Uncharacterized protein n=1 Tax=Spirodela intermedia TaxID=51605 RepID=A0A7I8KQ87_SPIIN|nr:unnamed protein product [Spirodela intermedia]